MDHIIGAEADPQVISTGTPTAIPYHHWWDQQRSRSHGRPQHQGETGQDRASQGGTVTPNPTPEAADMAELQPYLDSNLGEERRASRVPSGNKN